jgi:hypothetical protein
MLVRTLQYVGAASCVFSSMSLKSMDSSSSGVASLPFMRMIGLSAVISLFTWRRILSMVKRCNGLLARFAGSCHREQ